jgi:LmbE family N-acetylglucosaminyl deacetylase
MQRPAFIFAHVDDAAFSAFSALWTSNENALDVAVCLGVPTTEVLSPWDKLCGFLTSKEAILERRREHKKACVLTKAKPLILNILDDQYGECNQHMWQKNTQFLTDYLERLQNTVIFTHSKVSTHPDHIRVRCMAERIAICLQLPVVYTCDRPYFYCSTSNCHSENSIYKRHITTLGNLLNRKLELIECFSSQYQALNESFGFRWNHHEVLGQECYRIMLL